MLSYNFIYTKLVCFCNFYVTFLFFDYWFKLQCIFLFFKELLNTDISNSIKYDGLLNDAYLRPKNGHRVLLIQPRMFLLKIFYYIR